MTTIADQIRWTAIESCQRKTGTPSPPTTSRAMAMTGPITWPRFSPIRRHIPTAIHPSSPTSRRTPINSSGGTHTYGAVYKLTLQSDGRWKSTIIHSFTGGANGQSVDGGVVMDQAGNLYGTTIAGGSPNCQCGIVYKLTPGAGDKWNFKVLHTFVPK